MINTGEIFLKEVPALVEVEGGGNWSEKWGKLDYILSAPSGTFQDRPGKEIFRDGDMGEWQYFKGYIYLSYVMENTILVRP